MKKNCLILLLPFSLLLLAGCHKETEQKTVVASVPPVTEKAKSLPAPVPAVNPALANLKPSAKQFIVAKVTDRVALTFDAGSDDSATLLILKELQARNVRGTFFLTGQFCEHFPKACRAIADAGMEIGSHSYSHPHFPKISDAKIKVEMEKAEAAITKACGRGAKPLFRFPYGDFKPHACQVVASLGYQPIYWSLDSLDAYKERKTADFVAKRIDSRVKGGDVILMHVSSVGSAEALPRIFAQLEKIGAKAVPVSELMTAEPPAKPSPASKISLRQN